MTHQETMFAVIKKCEEIMDECGFELPSGIVYTMNKRFTKSMGRCKKTTRGGKVSFEIEFADKYFSEYIKQGKSEMIEDTILHEMCHTLPNCFNHGDEWQRVTGIVNKKFGYNLKRCYEMDEVVYKVKSQMYPTSELVCTKCGRHSAHKNTSVYIKSPERYKCQCGGSLKVRELSFDN